MEILLVGYLTIFLLFLGYIEVIISAVNRRYLSLYSFFFSIRMIVAILMFLFWGYLNAGGDASRYEAIVSKINDGSINSFQDIIIIYNDDSRYIYYIALCAAIDSLFGSAGVILFQSGIHLLSGFFLHLILDNFGLTKRKSTLILFLYIFYPYLVFYSAVYLRDIYIALATCWFVYGLTNQKTIFGKFFNLTIPLLIVMCIRVQYLPFYFLFYIAYYFYDKRGISWYQWVFIIIGLILLSNWSNFLSMDKLIPYLISTGEIEDNPNVAYSEYNALDYVSISKLLTTVIGIFGPYHMFYGGKYVFVEYRGDYVERFFEGLSAVLNVILLVCIGWYTISQRFIKKYKFLIRIHQDYRWLQMRKSILVFFFALVVLLSYVGYNRWKMPLVPLIFLYFGLCKIRATNFVIIYSLVIGILSLIIFISYIRG